MAGSIYAGNSATKLSGTLDATLRKKQPPMRGRARMPPRCAPDPLLPTRYDENSLRDEAVTATRQADCQKARLNARLIEHRHSGHF